MPPRYGYFTGRIRNSSNLIMNPGDRQIALTYDVDSAALVNEESAMLPQLACCYLRYTILNRALVDTDDLSGLGLIVDFGVSDCHGWNSAGFSNVEVDFAQGTALVLPASRVRVTVVYTAPTGQATAPQIAVDAFAAAGTKGSTVGASAVPRKTKITSFANSDVASSLVPVPAFARSFQVVLTNATIALSNINVAQKASTAGNGGATFAVTAASSLDGQSIPIVEGTQALLLSTANNANITTDARVVFNLAL